MWQTAGRQATLWCIFWLLLLISRAHLQLAYLLQKPRPRVYLANDVCSQQCVQKHFHMLNQVQTGPVIQESSWGPAEASGKPPTYLHCHRRKLYPVRILQSRQKTSMIFSRQSSGHSCLSFLGLLGYIFIAQSLGCLLKLHRWLKKKLSVALCPS